MARRETEQPVTLSVLDRLLEPELPAGRAESIRRLKAAMQRDLEWLLNARRTIAEPPEGAEEVESSVYCYGLPDICSLALQSVRDKSRLTKMMESAIANFEPRLAQVKVSTEPTDSNASNLHFVIEALLKIDPAPEHVSFDAKFEVANGEYRVRGEIDA